MLKLGKLVSAGILAICAAIFGIRLVAEEKPRAGNVAGKAAASSEGDPISPQEALAKITLPEGFRATLFAAEPDVVQPVAMQIDDRGRLWVAECLSYPKWSAKGNDRLTIFTDKDGDGRFDERKVFWDQGNYLTGFIPGFGGVWVCCAPHLLFIPDADGDDVPDGPPEIVLEGWSTKGVHNVINGLTWGPDGWLWGLNGITSPSKVGRPGVPDEQKIEMNCGVWRYHPTRKKFEVVCHGTTNPWGLDFNEGGEPFITNCVIAHLWHVVPGAHFQRMFGQDVNPHAYELMDPCADHLHWGGGDWTSSRGGKGVHSVAGGGHAHSGAMIYLGDSWPEEYRGSIFMCNIHGNRVNRDVLTRGPHGYVGKHADDFLNANDTWFRGINMQYGPDGGVFLIDWNDTGECHDHVAHRTSGRIYKIMYRGAKPVTGVDLQKLSDLELVDLQLHKNEWYVRHARRILQERAVAGKLEREKVLAGLKKIYAENDDVTRKLRALWAGYGIADRTVDLFDSLLKHESEPIRAAALRLVYDDGSDAESSLPLVKQLAGTETSPLVRLQVAGLLSRLPYEARWPIAESLVRCAAFEHDANLVRLTWYGIEPIVNGDPSRALALAASTKSLRLRKFIARRLAVQDATPVVHALSTVEETLLQIDLLQGLADGTQGKKITAPQGWPPAYANLLRSSNADVLRLARLQGAAFNDAAAIADLKKLAADAAANAEHRREAIELLARRRVGDFASILHGLLDDAAVRSAAIQALAAYDEEATTEKLISRYANFSDKEKLEAITTLSTRPKFALALFDGVDAGKIPASDVTVVVARQLAALNDAAVSEKLAKVWGAARPTSAEKQQRKQQLAAALHAGEMAKADATHGRQVFNKLCIQCHVLFGEGNKIGPDLTGAQRANLDYVLENLLDPSALIGRDYQLTVVQTADGRVVTGIVLEDRPAALRMKTVGGEVILPKEDIEAKSVSPLSMMPEGLMDKLTAEEIRDLVAYLAAPKQVPLAEKR